MEIIQDALFNLLITVVVGGLGVITVYATKYLNRLKDKLLTETKNIEDENLQSLINNVIYDTDKLIYTYVMSAYETSTKVIKETKADNVKEQLALLKEEVVKNVMCQLTVDTKKIMSNKINDIEEYVSNKIEVILVDIKENQ